MSAASGPVGALLTTWMLLVTARSVPSDGRFTRTGPAVPARRIASDVDPPPSRLSATTAPRDSMNSASSGSRTPSLQPACRPSTVARIIRPSAVSPTALRGWISSALAGRGEMETAPSRTIHSRPPTACWIDSHPAVTVVDRVTGSPGTRVASSEVTGTVSTTVPGSIGPPPSAVLVATTNPVQAPEVRRGSASPPMTRSIPDEALLVRLANRGVKRTVSPARRSWLTLLMRYWAPSDVVSAMLTNGAPISGRPSAPTPNVGRAAEPTATSSPASTCRPFGASSMSLA